MVYTLSIYHPDTGYLLLDIKLTETQYNLLKKTFNIDSDCFPLEVFVEEFEK